jgi:formyl-CoA transferase
MTSGYGAPASRAQATLAGLKVVELGQLLAGPFAGSLLADLGADVVHVEDPVNGDPSRQTGPSKDGIYPWWKVTARNKRSVGLDLRHPKGQELARRLVAWADVVVTNIRVGTLESWGLDWPALHATNPKLVVLQVSGYGAATTKRNAPGFGKVGEARSGVVHITGFPDGPPVHAGFSHADTVTGLMGAFAIQCAMYRRLTDPDYDGEWIDLAVDETLFRLIEWQVVVYDQLGTVPTRVGNGISGAPSAVVNAFRAADGRWLTITSGNVRTVQNIATLVGERPEDYASPPAIIERRAHLEELLGRWIATRTIEECQQKMDLLGVVAAPVLSVADILDDETYRERGNIVTVEDQDLGPLRMQGVIPRLANHTGEVWAPAPDLGQDNDRVFLDDIGLSQDEYRDLVIDGVIGGTSAPR